MHELQIERRFFAWHALRLYDGSLEPLHAHDWIVQVRVRGENLDAIEVVIDFHELERIVAAALDDLRDRNLNDHPAFEGRNPTAERVAEHIYSMMVAKLMPPVSLSAVIVTESPDCRATYAR